MIAWSWWVRARAEVCDGRFTLGKPRLDGEAVRHGYIRSTTKICTDVTKLPLAERVAAMPSFEGGNPVQDLSKNCALKIMDVSIMSSCVVTP